MKFVIGILVGVGLAVSVPTYAGFFGSAIGGAVGAHVATSGIEGKVDTINARLEALTRALDTVKVCK